MMIRTLLFLLVSASLTLRASEPISVPASIPVSATVKQPHVTAELIADGKGVSQSFDVILHLHSDPGWHTYWINPGDAGLATTIKWTLPKGFTAGPIQWPTPEKHKMGPLVTYGYEGDVYLLTHIQGPPAFDWIGTSLMVEAKASWLVCQEECIPGKGEFKLDIGAKHPDKNAAASFLSAVEARLPFENKGWNVSGAYVGNTLKLAFKNKEGRPETNLGTLQFFVEQPNVIDAQAAQTSSPSSAPGEFNLSIPLISNGDKPTSISGVLVSDVPLVSEAATGGDQHAVSITEFPVTSEVAAAVPSGGSAPPPSVAVAGPRDGTVSFQAGSEPSRGLATATEGNSYASKGDAELNAETPAQPFLLAVLGAAFIGGLILNLMPCVLPVLSLKVFSLIKHAEHAHSQAWKQGVAFTIGVVISFWLLAGLLLALRAAGNHLGWGFQMQSPGFVLALIFIFFILALNLFGVFELGTSLVGLDSKVTSRHNHGLMTSFLNGALATLAATPCTAPFMGSALGFAAQQPAFVSLLIFTFLAFGMAAPYLLLTIFPSALKIVPKPGAWMETFKQFMGFLLMATVIFLLYVFGALVGQDGVFELLFGLLLGAVAAWAYGGRQRSTSATAWSMVAVILFLIAGLGVGAHAAMSPTNSEASNAKVENGYQPWSQDAVQKALADGKPVFVDFTAAWCLSCKVNERVALDTDAVRKAFADKSVVLFKADWTHADPEISKALQQYNRDGVPLYLLYSPKQPTQPQVLPEVLTPGIVLDALNRL